MKEKEKIAVVGLQSGKLTGFIQKLAQEGFKILLTPGNAEQQQRMQDDIRSQDPEAKANVEISDLARGIREADILAFINPHDWDSELIDQLQERVAQKIIMAVFEGIPDEIAVERFRFLGDNLPDARMARVVVHPQKEEIFISGEDKEAVQAVSAVIEKSTYYINH